MNIGVTTGSNEFLYDSSFSDYDFGFAYYGYGQLRNDTLDKGLDCP